MIRVSSEALDQIECRLYSRSNFLGNFRSCRDRCQSTSCELACEESDQDYQTIGLTSIQGLASIKAICGSEGYETKSISLLEFDKSHVSPSKTLRYTSIQMQDHATVYNLSYGFQLFSFNFKVPTLETTTVLGEFGKELMYFASPPHVHTSQDPTNIGKAEIPMASFLVALPLGSRLDDVTISASLKEQNHVRIVPSKPAPYDYSDPEAIFPFIYDPVRYEGSRFRISDYTLEYLSDELPYRNIVRLRFPVIDYDPNTLLRKQYNEIFGITLQLAGTHNDCYSWYPIPSTSTNEIDTRFARSPRAIDYAVINPKALKKACSSSPQEGTLEDRDVRFRRQDAPQGMPLALQPQTALRDPHMIIVTSQLLRDEAIRFAKHKQSLGIKTNIINYNEGGPLGHQILRQDIESIYQKSQVKPRWLVLLGDVTHIPSYYDGFHVINSIDRIKNTGDTWYGQFHGDLAVLPKLKIGRLPAHNKLEASAMIDKIIQHELNPSTSPNHYDRIMAVASLIDHKKPGHSEEYAYAEYIENNLASSVEKQDISFERYYQSSSGLPPKVWSTGTLVPNRVGQYPWNQSRKQILRGIQSGPPSVFYRGHGSWEAWDTPSFDVEDVSQADLSPSMHYPFVVSVSCLNGMFDNKTYQTLAIAPPSDPRFDPISDIFPIKYLIPEYHHINFGEAIMLKPKGGIGFMGSTRSGTTGGNSTTAYGAMNSMAHLPIVSNGLVEAHPDLGHILTNAKAFGVSRYSIDSPILKEQNLTYNLLGDPSSSYRMARPMNIAETISKDRDETIRISVAIQHPDCVTCLTSPDAQSSLFTHHEPIAVFINEDGIVLRESLLRTDTPIIWKPSIIGPSHRGAKLILSGGGLRPKVIELRTVTN